MLNERISADILSDKNPFAESRLEPNTTEHRPVQAQPAKQQLMVQPRHSISKKPSKEKSPLPPALNAHKKSDRLQTEPTSGKTEKITLKGLPQQKIFKSRSHTDLQIQAHSDWALRKMNHGIRFDKKDKDFFAGLEMKSNQSKEARDDMDKQTASQQPVPKFYNSLFQIRNRDIHLQKPKPTSFQSRPSAPLRHEISRSLKSSQPSQRGDRKGEVLLIQQTTKSSDWVTTGSKDANKQKPYHTINENLMGSLNFAKNQTSLEMPPPDLILSSTENNKAPFYFDKDEYFFEERVHKKNLEQ
jgi:hypothetical protein